MELSGLQRDLWGAVNVMIHQHFHTELWDKIQHHIDKLSIGDITRTFERKRGFIMYQGCIRHCYCYYYCYCYCYCYCNCYCNCYCENTNKGVQANTNKKQTYLGSTSNMNHVFQLKLTKSRNYNSLLLISRTTSLRTCESA